MKKSTLLPFLVVISALLISTISYSETIVNESFESGFGSFTSEYGGAKVVSDPTTPLGSQSLQFIFSLGDEGGYAPDIVGTGYAPKKEIWGEGYFKLSSGYVFHPYEQKLIFIWGDTFNFYISISSWGDRKMFGCWQGSGSTYRNASGPDIKTGIWYKLNFHMKMNSAAGAKDGIFQIWLNDALVLDFSNVPYQGSGQGSDHGFHSMAFTPVYGGDSTPVPQKQYIWFDGAKISTTPIGTSPQTGQPAPPFGLRIN